ncbi:hypothetical protein [Anaerotignum sp.]|uniref:hypothetical protein n=1 Tax=Anaerotignum sp. TaxID=2039241 RepID=UPI003332875A
MAYATYEFYRDSYGGDSISLAEFSRFARRASEYIDMVTFGRAVQYPDDNDALKRACCAVAEAYKINEEGGGIVAESVGKITRNYAASVTNTPTQEERLGTAVSIHLLATGLLYLGV